MEVQQDYLILNSKEIEIFNILVNFALITFSSLLITTNSKNDCEDGYFTGYLVSMTLFSLCVFLYIIFAAIVEGLNLKEEKYKGFFQKLLVLNFILVFINFLGNVFAGNNCGFYSVRGFAAFMITASLVLALLVLCLLACLSGCILYCLPKFNANPDDENDIDVG